MSKFSFKINTSISVLIGVVLLFVVGTVMFVQYKSSNEFALLTTQKVFDRVADKVINQINTYDSQSTRFVKLSQKIDHADDLPSLSKRHTLLPIITEYIKTANYVYAVYLGFQNNDFYIIYNLNLSEDMKKAQNAPNNARWLIKKNLKDENGNLFSHKLFVDKNFVTLSQKTEPTTYQPTQRPWYKDASNSKDIIKTNPYIFSSVQQPGVTYAQRTLSKNGVVFSLDITLSSLNKLLSQQNLVEGSAAFIFKKDGKPVAQFDQITNTKIENLTKSYPNSFIKNGKVIDLEEQKIVTIKGVKYLKYTTELKSNFKSKDYLTILSPMNVIMKPYTDKIYQTLMITALILIFLLPIIIYSIRTLVKPILQLGRENKKIEEGRFKDVKSVDSFMIEINGLSQSLVSMSNAIEESQRTLESKVEMRTADLNIAKKEIEATHKHTRESIEYASLIQGALLPDENLMANYFIDYFVHWLPKDTVGGDIWLFNELRHEDECLLFFIDCTGHGVPGAFVTMIVKAIEREIITKIMDDPDMDVSPAWIMSYFNQTMKVLLKQETKDSKSNAGWDGGVIYYNKKTQLLKFAGAETPLFYLDADGTFNTIKGNRYSVGYKKCAMDYAYKETIIEVEEGMKFYCTTDGYLDQNGGEKDFPFSKKRFGNIIKDIHTKPMVDQKEIFIDEMDKYESMIENNDRNDDMTVIAFEIGKTSCSPDIILKYSGVFTQNIIANNITKLENSITNINEQSKVYTLVIELTQNIMNYSKVNDENTQISQDGSIVVLKTHDNKYLVNSQNIISLEDKDILEPILKDIQTLSESEIRTRYRELRRSGEKTHEKGGGIGFYEIAKLVSSIEYNFTTIDESNFTFELKCIVKS